MRTSILVAVLATATAASARPRTYTIQVPQVQRPPNAAVSSNIIFLHRCEGGGCLVHFGAVDDSRTDTSQIAQHDTTLSAFSQTDDVWQAVVQCVRDTYAPFNIQITDVDPGNVPHFEEMVGGTPDQLRNDIPSAGGVAPFTCDEVPNGISFTFDVYGPNADELCWTVAQETAHTFGLEHEYLAKDPMTYVQGDLPKRFQWADGQCGTNTPKPCQCSATGTQNSYKKIYDKFGMGAPSPPNVAILSPTNGKTVTPMFQVRVDANDDAAIDHVELWVDGAMTTTSAMAPFSTIAPMLAEGPHMLEVHALDVTNMPGQSAAISITQGPPCTADKGCTGTDVCVMGGCIPGPDMPGGLGSICQSSTECLSGLCVNGGEPFMHCAAACDPATAASCPNGFSCLAADTGGVCWQDSGGCCSAAGDPTGSFVLASAVLGLVVLRRRRRRQ